MSSTPGGQGDAGFGGPHPGPHDQPTQEMRGGPPPQQQWAQGGGPGYAQQPAYSPSPQRTRVHVRSTFLTTEFWTFLLLSLMILIAAAIVDEADGFGFGAQEAWKYVTWLGVAYMLSRGLTKLGGGRRDGGDSGLGS